ncbi:MAG: hypothetical protein M3O15_13205, partial [Acidobacteriota bacterium]|nr:hypothetical protein [Acidobacteriota bacterium]
MSSLQGVGQLAIAWLRLAPPRERILIGTAALARGPEGGPFLRLLFSRPERGTEVRGFVRTYAPFRAPMLQGALLFNGKGTAATGPVERRMLLEWTRAVAAEAAGGSLDGAYGLVFAWHRGASAGGLCDSVAVYLDGDVTVRSCATPGEMRGRLDMERLGRLYRCFDELAPLQSAGQDGVRADALTTRLILAGRGGRSATPEEVAELEALGTALERELSSSQRAASAPSPALAAAPAAGSVTSQLPPSPPPPPS